MGDRPVPARKAAAPLLHIISHGPHCLDGVVSAVVVARYFEGVEAVPHFATNREIDDVVRSISQDSLPPGAEVWITDISWTTEAADDHLCRLAERGVKIYWFDHHRTALERYRAGAIRVPFADAVVKEDYAAARLVYEYLEARARREGKEHPSFAALRRLVAMADDNDRWLHRLEGSRELSLTVRAMAAGSRSLDPYHALLRADEEVTYTEEMQWAFERATREIQASLELAESSRLEVSVPGTGLSVVAAMCNGYPSEVADRWAAGAKQTVFALYDARGLAVSLRRSPDCGADLSRVAGVLGGGGHTAAAGCSVPALHHKLVGEMGRLVAEAVDSLYGGGGEQGE